ncbi:TetR family transcriptional regulator [Mycobacterium colombiense]|uniref:TetR family transcriptional regulator n=1 Tax=Mycobacterium colombiense TaxID=339268 RepID=A0A1A3S2N6_9MYCO|nr:TetR/AcrR family transcriptional regulator [Mycobacterium colombiense]OBH53001.1 TetR family transcriptional regulator [Mycobacterium colombiense]OBJ34164.1 TetR family transcriptional regulator [Mycobacterium colombiense]OBJ44116.1 TetR family transcriptional regulator [Mycobacterium colombiense]OBJ70901.1 TetR family transcriptional regulator [Mycobacterium colombiense]OBK64825.1 TetR family transcriptional regulator [Mycobacterium colombiense]
MARTQQQRREETVGRLIDACIATIIEIGYAKASAAVIAKRAGVSVGALFRHFDTMGDFMAATASEVLRRQLESFTKGVAEIPADRPALQAVLEILREITSGPTNAVIYELTVAARTDEKLRDTLQHELAQYAAKIDDVARAMPGIEVFPEDTFLVLVALMRNVFDGAAVIEGVLPQPEVAAQRIPVLMALLTAALPDS